MPLASRLLAGRVAQISRVQPAALATDVATAGVLGVVGDVACQLAVEGQPALDSRRVVSLGVFNSAYIGSFLHLLYQAYGPLVVVATSGLARGPLRRRLRGPDSLLHSLGCSLVDNVHNGLIYIPAYFFGVGLLQGDTLSAAATNLRAEWWTACAARDVKPTRRTRHAALAQRRPAQARSVCPCAARACRHLVHRLLDPVHVVQLCHGAARTARAGDGVGQPGVERGHRLHCAPRELIAQPVRASAAGVGRRSSRLLGAYSVAAQEHWLRFTYKCKWQGLAKAWLFAERAAGPGRAPELGLAWPSGSGKLLILRNCPPSESAPPPPPLLPLARPGACARAGRASLGRHGFQ